MALTYRGVAAAYNASIGGATTLEVTTNQISNLADGDLLVAIVVTEDNCTIAADTGTWQEFTSQPDPTSYEHKAFWRQASSEPSSWYFSCTQSADDMQVIVMAFYDSSGPGTWGMQDDDGGNISATTPGTALSIDVAHANDLVVGLYGSDDDIPFTTSPTDYTPSAYAGMTKSYISGTGVADYDQAQTAVHASAWYKLDSASGTKDCTWQMTDTASEEASALVATFTWTPSTTYELSGFTKDSAGSALGSCHTFLFKDNGDDTATFVAYQLSNSSTGVYSFTGITDDDANYFVIAWKDDTPHVMDTTDYVLQPIEE